MKLSIITLVSLVAAVVCDEAPTPASAQPASTAGMPLQPLDQARIVASKFLLSQYAVEDKEFVVDYRLYNVGDKAALKVTLDDRHNFPTTHFENVRGQLQVRWERIAPGANVSHSVVMKPRFWGGLNYTAAIVHYYAQEGDDSPRTGYTSSVGEGYVYRLKDYERKFSPHYVDWAIFSLMAATSLGLPLLLWLKSKNKYEKKDEQKKQK